MTDEQKLLAYGISFVLLVDAFLKLAKSIKENK